MLHFGRDVASKAIAKAPNCDTDLLKLMPAGCMPTKKPKKAKVHAQMACRQMDYLIHTVD